MGNVVVMSIIIVLFLIAVVQTVKKHKNGTFCNGCSREGYCSSSNQCKKKR